MPGFLRESLKLHNQGRRELSPLELASIHAHLGDKTEAIGLLRQCVRDHNPWLVEVNTNPDFDSLRSDPRFQDVVRAVRLTE